MPNSAAQRLPRTLLLGGTLLTAALVVLIVGVLVESLWLTFFAGAGGIAVGMFVTVWSFRGKLRSRRIRPSTQSKVSAAPTKGRSTQHASRPDSALAARVFGVTTAPGAMAVVATDSLAGQTSRPYVQLVPGLVRSQLDAIQPTVLLVEEAALRLHPWSGALDPGNGGVLDQLVEATEDVRSRGGDAYIVHDPAGQGFGSRLLRAKAIALTQAEATHIIREPGTDRATA